VGRQGYKTVNLGVSGDTTGDMRRRIEQTLSEGRPDTVVVFGGVNDAQRGVDPAEIERNVAFMVEWLRDHGIRKVVLIAPALVTCQPTPDWASSADEVRRVLRDVADRYGALCVDLTLFLRDRIERGEDLDFSRVRYRQSRSWYVEAGDPHLNAYGQRLVAAAFLTATSGWRRSRGRRRLWPLQLDRRLQRGGP
jgi:lysophospholipase L1-like esterase